MTGTDQGLPRPSALRDDWLAVAKAQPSLRNILERHGIATDAAYLAARSRIDDGDLARFDLLRFKIARCRDPSDANDSSARLEDFAGAPPEVLAVPISRMRFSTRAKTRLESARLNTIGDVVTFGTARLGSIDGAGRKMIEEIYNGFVKATEQFLVSRTIIGKPRCLSEELRRWLLSLDERRRVIVVARLGLSVAPETLEVLGTKFNLTRERVRQLESKAVRQEMEAELWPKILAERLGQILANAREPIWLASLPFHHGFFEEFEHGERALARVIETFAPGVGYCIEVNGGLLFSRLSELDFQELRQRALEIGRDSAKRRLSYTEFVVTVESLAFSHNAKELSAMLVDAVRPLVHLARPPGSAEPILVAFGRGVDHIVAAVLEEADTPLHYSEIHRRVMRRGYPDVDERRVHSALDKEGVFLFARGTYGLWRHFEVTEPTANRVVLTAEAIVLGVDRQWHAGEILESLRSEVPDLVGDIDVYGINAILTRSKELRYLGRMVWVAASSQDKDSSDRIDIAQACTRFLREAGQPLSRAELLDRLRNWRGIGSHFQIHVSEDVIPVAPGIFGLRSRDLPVSPTEMEKMLDCVDDALRKRGVGLHASELTAVFDASNLAFASRVNHATFYAIASRDSRLQVDAGGYVGLAGWDDTRRLSITAAGRRLAKEGTSPMSLDELRERLSVLVGRPLSRLDAANTLRDNGYTYDPNAKIWTLPPECDETQTP